jgi:hypothetical protein
MVGSGFGARPAGQNDDANSCGQYASNGDVFGENFFFTDVGNFTAGEGTPGNSSCIGLVVAVWTRHLVIFRFGSAYNSFDHWYLSNGDQYEITLPGGATASGTVAGLK